MARGRKTYNTTPPIAAVYRIRIECSTEPRANGSCKEEFWWKREKDKYNTIWKEIQEDVSER